MGVKDNFIHEECMKELDTMFKSKRSFGEYFDSQRDRIVKDMQDKNKQQNVEWMERYEKRKKMVKEMLLLKKMTPVGPKEKKLLNDTLISTVGLQRTVLIKLTIKILVL